MFNLQARLASICWKHVFAVHPHLKSSVGKLGKQEPFALLSVSLQKKGFGGFEVRSQPIEKRFKLPNDDKSTSTLNNSLAAYLKSHPDISSYDVEVKRHVVWCRFNASFLSEQIRDVAVNGVRLPTLPVEERRRVVVDFSSPNVAKELHVGHLRSTIVGDSIARILEFCGNDVIRQNHIGDWGTQFGMLIAYLLEENPELRHATESSQFNLSLSELELSYKEAKKRFDSCEEFKVASRETVVRLQSKQELEMRLWSKIVAVSREAFESLYKRLNVSLMERGESFYAPFIPELLSILEKKGVLEKSDGRWILPVKGYKVPLILVKSDGGYTYDTTDLAALWHRVHVVKANWLVYVVDSGQSLHFNTLFAAARQYGLCPDEVRMDHVAFGLVLTPEGKRIKTRSGSSTKLVELLDEACRRADSAFVEKKAEDELLTEESRRQASDTVAIACVRFADLRLSPSSSYIFDYNSMLDKNGATAVFVMYALARLRSIHSKHNLSAEEIIAAAEKESIMLEHEREKDLALKLLCFPVAVEEAATRKLQPSVIANYIIGLAHCFSDFYQKCYVVTSDPDTKEILSVNMSRVILCHVTMNVMVQALDLLGIKNLRDRL